MLLYLRLQFIFQWIIRLIEFVRVLAVYDQIHGIPLLACTTGEPRHVLALDGRVVPLRSLIAIGTRRLDRAKVLALIVLARRYRRIALISHTAY